MWWCVGDHLSGVPDKTALERQFAHAEKCRVYLEDCVEKASTAAKAAKIGVTDLTRTAKGGNIKKVAALNKSINECLRATGEDFDSDEAADQAAILGPS